MLTVACLLVRGHVGFTPEYVFRLRSMVARTLRQPHRFVCFTDQPDRFRNSVDTITIKAPPGCFAWWAKIELFNARHGLKGRVLYLDLDVLIVRSLASVAGQQERPFALVPHAGQWQGKGRQVTIPRYNSSVMVYEVCDRLALLYDRWTPSVAARLWGDQDWIAENFPHEHTMPVEWFPRFSEVRDPPAWPPAARVVLCKKPKNHVALQTWPWFDQIWR
jgi:hypothetical protein